MFSQLDEVEKRYEELTAQMGDPSVAGDPKRYAEVAREQSGLLKTVETWRAFKECRDELENIQELFGDSDPEIRELAKLEAASLEERLPELEIALKFLLLPKDPNDEKNVILEIRAGTGGDEASLFAGDLLRMYSRFSDSMRWKTEIISSSDNGIGGYKEAIVMISGDQVYARLKFESGVHRVQRVPELRRDLPASGRGGLRGPGNAGLRASVRTARARSTDGGLHRAVARPRVLHGPRSGVRG